MLDAKDVELASLKEKGKQDVLAAETRTKEQAETDHLVNVAEELTLSRVQTLVPAEGYQDVVAERLGLHFENAKYSREWLVFHVVPRVLTDRPFHLGDARTVTTTTGEELETRIVRPTPSAEDQARGILRTERTGDDTPARSLSGFIWRMTGRNQIGLAA